MPSSCYARVPGSSTFATSIESTGIGTMWERLQMRSTSEGDVRHEVAGATRAKCFLLDRLLLIVSTQQPIATLSTRSHTTPIDDHYVVCCTFKSTKQIVHRCFSRGRRLPR
ncbi:hypothetical protein QCA50_010422 [Cerrena zonata]|uniref:Uncharacterized protein n=1 Tax=Cerrena zonata TaxID=2478898 RepID=A0AAW0G8P1_9APHY